MALFVPRSRGLMATFVAVTSAVFPLQMAAAQNCDDWLENKPEGAANGSVLATTEWDPDGSGGPIPPVLVVGGSFTAVGGRTANRIATWDGERWGTLGNGFTREVLALTVRSDGALIASSGFGSNTLLWEWTGSEWASLLTLPNSSLGSRSILAMCPLPDGSIVIGGNFQFLEANQVTRSIAIFNGTTVTRMGSIGLTQVTKLLRRSNGELLAVGSQGSFYERPQRWDGTSWSDVASILAAGHTLLERPNGHVIFGQSDRLYEWDGGILFTRLGGSITEQFVGEGILATTLLSDGSILAAHGPYNYIDMNRTHVSRWDGNTWTRVGEPVETVVSSVLTVDPHGRPFMGMLVASGNRTVGAQIWTGSRWVTPSEGFNGSVSDIAVSSTGEVLICGTFDAYGVDGMVGLARRDASTATGFAPIVGPWESMSRVAISPEGTIFGFGAYFGALSSSTIYRIQEETAPVILGSATGVTQFIAPSENELIAVGSFTTFCGVPARRAAIWRPEGVTELGGGLDGTVQAVTKLASGAIIVGGTFTTAGVVPASNIAMLQNSEWTALEGGLNGGVRSIQVLNDGRIAVAGAFTLAGGAPAAGLAFWDGTSWTGQPPAAQGLAPTSIDELIQLPSGDLVARVTYVDGVSRTTAAKLSNGIWSALGDVALRNVVAMAVDSLGEVLVGGNAMTFGGIRPTFHYARFTFTGTPRLALQPIDTTAAKGSAAELSVQVASGYDRFGPLTYAWTKNGSPVTNDERISGVATATLRIAYARVGDAGAYVCTVGNGCGEAVSTAADLTIEGCVADYDGSGSPDNTDIVVYFEDWEAGDGAADIDGDSDVDSDDLIGFFDAWDSGC